MKMTFTMTKTTEEILKIGESKNKVANREKKKKKKKKKHLDVDE